ncbi:MAG: hypothetical protein ACE5LL_07060 [Alphaproteobacteria bacterium]
MTFDVAAPRRQLPILELEVNRALPHDIGDVTIKGMPAPAAAVSSATTASVAPVQWLT